MKRRLLIVALLFVNLFVFSQQPTIPAKKTTKKTSKAPDTFSNLVENAKVFSPNGIVRCATTEYHQSQQERRMAPSDADFEAWLAPRIEEIKRQRLEGRLPAVIKIPVVVHVIHNGSAVGVEENIPDGQVISQITVFNQDFRKLPGTPGFGTGVDTTIEFCLAQVDPNGNPTNGIDRRNLGIASFNQAAVQNAKASTIWDPTRYLNMWTFKFGGNLAQVLGYAQFPSGSGLPGMTPEDCVSGEASTDGVVCNYTAWGSRAIFSGGNYGSGRQYDRGRTMTHEVGHMLGLRHTWGDGGCEVDDFCADTPNCSGQYYSGTNVGGCISPVQCGNTRQVENYMDYSDDRCMSVFTQDQKDRMLAVMMNSPRRDDLLVSTVCTPSTAAFIQFKRQVCEQRAPKTVVEGNGCAYTEYTIPVSIDKAPTANAVVTFNIDASSVADANDIQIMTPTVTFNAGSTAENNFVFRVLNDNAVEPDEELVISFTVNANGGNAVENPKGGNIFTTTIVNDDTALTPISNNVIFYDGFETYPDFAIGNVGGWTMLDVDGKPTFGDDTYDFPNEQYRGTFIVFNPSQTTPSALDSGYDAHSGNKGYYCFNAESSTGVSLNNDYIFTPQLTLGTNSQLKFWAKSLTNNYNGGERFRVEVSTTNTNPSSFTLISPAPYTVPPLSWTQYTYDLSAYNNQTIYIAIHVVSSDEFVFMLDDVEVTSNVQTNIQTTINTATAGQGTLNGAGVSSFRDAVSGNIAATVTINDAASYGCATVAVSRDLASAGAPAVSYNGSAGANLALAKQFTITPTTVLNGSATVMFYFTEQEIAAWETATGSSRTQLYVTKDGASPEVQPLTIGSFGTGVTLTANFATGINGVYSFAVRAALPTQSFELTGITLYPNPNKGSFNLQFTPVSNQINVTIHDIRGRSIFNKDYQNTGLFNEMIQMNDVQSGIYLVSVQDGTRKTVKKIVIE